jgi:superfamily II DNA or RNA helicase
LAVIPHPTPVPSVGSLVNVRGRDWVVLPSADPDVLRLRPLTGGEQEVTGIFLPLEGQLARPAHFPVPDPEQAGDATGGLLLRDAARLAIRNGAAPFRSLGRIAVTPRPYQFVPLIMALRLDPVRLLLADDVGVGKTIEAAMIARELLDRGFARQLAVLCPPHLCEQWQAELREKFAIDAAVIQPATIGRLERNLPRLDLGVYQYYRHLVISIDYAKTDRNRRAFLDNAADLVIVDEAHTAARPPTRGGSTQHQRYALLRDLATDASRNLILVTATPHSGIEESFRSLLGLLDSSFDMEGEELDRKSLLPHVVQRRRKDLQHWLGEITPFPERRSEERAYALSPEYHRLFEDVLAYCRETIGSGEGLRRQQQRVRHWAAIALLRCVLSSPAAAEAVLAARREGLAEAEAPDTVDEIDATYRPQVLDPIEEGGSGDYAPVAPLQDAEPDLSDSERRRLSAFMRRSTGLAGPEKDVKLAETAKILQEMLREGLRPIVFCRFIATAHYLKEWLPRLLGKEFADLQVDPVTGEIGDEERREKVDVLAGHPVRVLVATDCLSEGINLQEAFDAVIHFDLPWNPNRLEQREGRVDRFGQRRKEVRTTILYGADNPVDQVVLDVLVRKAREIRRQLGISVPVPIESDGVIQAVVDSVLLRRPGVARQLRLGLTDPEVSRLHREWQKAADKEGRDRAYFAQHGIQPHEVAAELAATDPVLGNAATVQRFVANAAQRLGGELRPLRAGGVFELIPGAEMTRVLTPDPSPATRRRGETKDAGTLRVAFDPLQKDSAIQLGRTHPIVATYCETVLGKALSPDGDARFARCGAIFTNAVEIRTAIALLRLRYILRDRAEEYAEEVVLAAFRRERGRPEWLEPWERARELLETARPAANMEPAERAGQVSWALDLLDANPDWAETVIAWRVAQLQESNDRLRSLVKTRKLEIEPHVPPDILGIYVLVPAGGAGR